VTSAYQNYVKVRLTGPDGNVETPWAKRVGDYFRLDNLPWFAFNLSEDDIIEATPTEYEGLFDFVRVHRPSGNRLLRITFAEPEGSQPVLDHLMTMGCRYEGLNRKFFAVSVPPAVDFDAVAIYLIETCQKWDQANPAVPRQSPPRNLACE
jgi:hypothetical protein